MPTYPHNLVRNGRYNLLLYSLNKLSSIGPKFSSLNRKLGLYPSFITVLFLIKQFTNKS